MNEVLAGIGTAVGLAIAGFVVQLLREQTKRIKDDRLRNFSDVVVNGLEQAIRNPGHGEIKQRVASSIMYRALGTPRTIRGPLVVGMLDEPIGDGNRVKMGVATDHTLAIEAAVHRMKQAEGK